MVATATESVPPRPGGGVGVRVVQRVEARRTNDGADFDRPDRAHADN
jgi:hypothetical protein